MKFPARAGRGLPQIGRDQRGSAVVMFAVCLTVFVAMASISVDVGREYVQRQRYKISNDSAAFAGAAVLPDQTAARAAATHILQANKVDPAQASITFSPDGTTIYVNTQASVSTTFARVLGISQVSVAAVGAARSASPNQVTGVIPIGVAAQNLTYGQVVTLKAGASGHGSRLGPGNFGALALGGNGASTYSNTFTNGYSVPLSRGDVVTTQPGNMAGPTNQACTARLAQETEDNNQNDENDDGNHQFQGQEYGQNGSSHYRTGSRRVVFVPVIDDSDPHGRGEVEVVGFAAFHLEGCGSGQVTGRFVRTITEAQLDDGGTDYGLRAVKLVDR